MVILNSEGDAGMAFLKVDHDIFFRWNLTTLKSIFHKDCKHQKNVSDTTYKIIDYTDTLSSQQSQIVRHFIS